MEKAKGILGRILVIIQGKVLEEILGRIPRKISIRISKKITGRISRKNSGRIPKRVSCKNSGKIFFLIWEKSLGYSRDEYPEELQTKSQKDIPKESLEICKKTMEEIRNK